TWTHIVGVYNSSASPPTLTLYVNGQSQGSTAAATTPFAANGPLAIGRGWYNAAASNHWNGSISDVQVYPSPLSGSDLATLCADGRNGGALHARLLTTTRVLDQRGLPTSIIDPRGNTTSYLYDEAGKLAQVTAPAISTEVDGGAPVMVHPITTYG